MHIHREQVRAVWRDFGSLPTTARRPFRKRPHMAELGERTINIPFNGRHWLRARTESSYTHSTPQTCVKVGDRVPLQSPIYADIYRLQFPHSLCISHTPLTENENIGCRTYSTLHRPSPSISRTTAPPPSPEPARPPRPRSHPHPHPRSVAMRARRAD